ncbi:bacterio-opsin activator domain-containing protein [Halostella salina]|uniref:bacterio-opsin activator domain-containing protein n=1 Tax=Halostella salina TaxID=1547897 RepID=UPI0013CF1B3B|nr:bacterio-opsin activator domain-containing protein [Halostella salina]
MGDGSGRRYRGARAGDAGHRRRGSERGDSRLLPRVVEGTDTDYVENREFCTETDGTESEPSVWAVRIGEPKFVQDFRDLFETPWRDAAIEHGYRSGAALPLLHDGIPFGVLAVYHEEPNRYDGAERQLLTDLADTVAFAIHSLEAGRALSSDRVHEATLQVSGDGYYLLDVVSEAAPGAADAAVTVQGTMPTGDGELLQYLRLDGIPVEAFRTAVTDIGGDDTPRFQVTVSGAVPEVDLASLGAVVRSASVTATSAVLEAELPAKRDRRSFVDVLEERYGSATMLSCVEAEREETARIRVDTHALTEKQATSLEAAFHHGYFE